MAAVRKREGRGDYLADTWVAMQEEDATASLASDDVGECVRVRHECLDEFLLIGSQYQLIEGSIIEYYITLLREDLITRFFSIKKIGSIYYLKLDTVNSPHLGKGGR